VFKVSLRVKYKSNLKESTNKKDDKMMQDITYCEGGSCIHRRGCKRWLGNYKNSTISEMYRYAVLQDPNDCIKSDPPYEMLWRVRNSNEEGYLE
jgi:hypothetical protein